MCVIDFIVFQVLMKILVPVWGGQSKSATLVNLLRYRVLTLTGFYTEQLVSHFLRIRSFNRDFYRLYNSIQYYIQIRNQNWIFHI